MPAVEPTKPATPRQRASSKYENLSPLEAALVDQIAEGNANVVASVDRLADKAPDPRLVLAVGSSVALAGLALVVYLASLVAAGRGIDPLPAAEATKVVVEAVVEDEKVPAPPAPAVEPPPATEVE